MLLGESSCLVDGRVDEEDTAAVVKLETKVGSTDASEGKTTLR